MTTESFKNELRILDVVKQLSLTTLHQQRVPEPITGVYLLLRGEAVIYVGQSTDIFRRVHYHRASKVFDIFRWLECNEADIHIFEACFILKYNPPLNKHLPQQRLFCSIPQMKKLLGWNLRDVKKYIRQNQIQLYHMGLHRYCKLPDFMEALVHGD